ncbi:MAG: cation transporter [Melioribacteraceae bacterium]|nr:cation transporter [Melioribacteraceae bacterium]
MSTKVQKAANIVLFSNIFLFILKAIIGILSNSIAIISEALNSLTDIIASIAITVGVKVSYQKADQDHQFGHSAAQPIAAFIVAVFTIVVGLEIFKESVYRIISPEEIEIGIFVYIVLAISILVKLFLNKYLTKLDKQFNSTALRASATDSLNDVLASSIALIGVICVSLGYSYVDGIAGLVVAVFILKAGWDIGKENIDFLMGRSADNHLVFDISKAALNVDDVLGLNDLRSHYVGDKFHIEIHVEVDKNMSTKQSHDIGKDVQRAIESLGEVQKVFVHIDPV